MKSKKYISIASSLIALLICLGGCGSESETSAQSSEAASDMASSAVSAAASAEAEEKLITVTVVVSDTDSRSYEITTDAENLRDAMEAEGKIEGDESEFGLFITAVDGVAADDSKQEWWCLTKDGEMWNYGIDSTKIENGDVFELTLTTGY